MSRFTEYLARKQAEHGAKFDPSELAPQFVEGFNEGNTFRVKVQSPYGGKPYWGFVGITTGWKPAFLLMFRRGQIGSSFVLGKDYKVLASKRI